MANSTTYVPLEDGTFKQVDSVERVISLAELEAAIAQQIADCDRNIVALKGRMVELRTKQSELEPLRAAQIKV